MAHDQAVHFGTPGSGCKFRNNPCQPQPRSWHYCVFFFFFVLCSTLTPLVAGGTGGLDAAALCKAVNPQTLRLGAEEEGVCQAAYCMSHKQMPVVQ